MALATVMLAPTAGQAGGDHYYGYGYGYCRDDSRIYSDYRRLQRDNDALRQQLNHQARTCQNTVNQQQQAYQQIINQHRGANAQLLAQSADSSALMASIAENQGVPEDLFDRPTRAEFDALQERYDRLMSAYRNLERDYRDATKR